MAALDAIRAIVPEQKVHAVGYCLGGTLLSIAAAAMARDGDDRLKSVTLLAAQTDFTEAGELMLFINESQVAFLEDMMWEQGFLDTKQMAGAFQMLRSNDLIWSRMVREYLMGERAPMIDLMAWNADATRMPYRMHSEYLRRLFLNNDLRRGALWWSTSRSRSPIFVRRSSRSAPMRDHVAPWRSTYKINFLTDTDVTYLLTTGGHNAGIVSEPGHDHRGFQVMTTQGRRPLRRSGYLPGASAAQGRFLVAGMGRLARCALGRAGRSARNGRGGLCPDRRRARQLRAATVRAATAIEPRSFCISIRMQFRRRV